MNFEKIAHRVIKEEAEALEILAAEIPDDFSEVVKVILALKGRVITTGIGKSGFIARKIAASLASTGTPSMYVHPSEASHGDLGMITAADLILMLSNSGETKELMDILNYCKRFEITIVVMTMNKASTIAENSNFLLHIPLKKEASLISAPTTSALMMLALGDALTTSLHEAKGFTKDDFLIFHPGGKIGANLIKVKNLMKQGADLPIVQKDENFSNVILVMTEKMLGCALVADADKNLLGIITDGDLRRHISDNFHLLKAENVMTKNPKSITQETLLSEALRIMNAKAITVLPVLQGSKIQGLIHIHEILKAGVSG